MNNNQKIKRFITKHDISDLTITELSNQIGVSHSAIVRFARESGYTGYKELKFQIVKGKKYLKDRNDINTNNMIFSLTSTIDSLNKKDLDIMANTINKYRNIVIVADGVSGEIGSTFMRFLRKINIDAELIRPAGDIHLIIPKNDAVYIFISISGTNPNFKRAIMKIKNDASKMVHIFSIVGSHKSNISDHSNAVIKAMNVQYNLNAREYPIVGQIAIQSIVGILFEKVYNLDRINNDKLTKIILNRHK